MRLLLLLLAAVLTTLPARAQPAEPAPRANPYGTGLGMAILVTNNGFGLGGYYHRAVSPSTAFLAELSIGAGKSDREIQFFGFGTSYIPRKANYLLMAPLQGGLVQRLFRNQIEDNFRPYVQLTAGPTLGWEYPYFRDLNGNGRYDPDYYEDVNLNGRRDRNEPYERTYDAIGALPRGSARLGAGGTLALGAHFGRSRKVTQGVRFGYTFSYFFDGIELLEPDVQPPQRFFGTPSLTLTFGRLY